MDPTSGKVIVFSYDRENERAQPAASQPEHPSLIALAYTPRQSNSSLTRQRSAEVAVIRAYTSNDWTEVCRIFDISKPVELAFGKIAASFVPLASDEKRQAEFHRATVFVDAEASHLRGFIGFENAYIGWMFVDPVYFRTGVARALLQSVLPQIPPFAWLWVLKENLPAIALYRGAGFEIVEERKSQNQGHVCIAVKMVLSANLPNNPAPRNADSRPSSEGARTSAAPSTYAPGG